MPWLSRRARDRRGATAVEFAAVGSALFLLLLMTVELSMQLLSGLVLEYGAVAAARFGVTGAVIPPGMTPPPATRAEAIARLVVQYSGGLLVQSRLTLSMASYGSFAALKTHTGGVAGPGAAGQVVQYTLSYDQPFVTRFPTMITGASTIVHHATVVVQNEPFPSP